MNKSITKLVSLVSAGTLCCGCATVNTNVFPHGKGEYTVVATSSEQNEAMDGAMKKARETCRKSHKNLNVLEREIQYSGVNKNVKTAMNVASTASFFNDGPDIPSGYSASNPDDYKVTIEFKCE